ncbi:hypothetical protein AAF712_007909 [Marasmius tenuissimus]|uniref:DNA2/NAM7 helicase-like C-terminal domain-containing protein n=1 Tax=Marasmius tenuissimus TaxID=585030 RepID=A0ABR2ZWA6_9AGAR
MPERPPTPPTFLQNLIDGGPLHSQFSILETYYLVFPESDLTHFKVQKFLEKSPGPLGISPGYNERTKALNAIAVVGEVFCLVVEFKDRRTMGSRRRGRGRRRNRSRSEEDSDGTEEEAVGPKELTPQLRALQQVFDHPAGVYAFNLAPLALGLYSDFGLIVRHGINIQSANFDPEPEHELDESTPVAPKKRTNTSDGSIQFVDLQTEAKPQLDEGNPVSRQKGPDTPGGTGDLLNPLEAILACVGKAVTVLENNITSVFMDLTYHTQSTARDTPQNSSLRDMMMRAWISRFLATFENGPQTFGDVPAIDLGRFEHDQIAVLARVASDAFRLDYLKPLQTVHQFSESAVDGDIIRVTNDKFQNRLRRDRTLKVEVQNQQGARYNIASQAGDMSGRETFISKNNMSSNALVTTITSIGRDVPTRAEQQKGLIVLRTLQGKKGDIQENPWIKNIWFPPEGELSWPEEWTTKTTLPSTIPDSSLNPSQTRAVEHMLSPANDHRIVVVRGPPGTGKTSVIAKYVTTVIDAGGGGIWLVAKSNVAVKNIAEKLVKEKFLRWKLLVSKDFQVGWHEHLYQQILDRVIRSDRFMSVKSKELADCKVILCTLSMLSARLLKIFTRAVPIQTLVVDEASQIEIGDYFHAFEVAKGTLRKMCLIGDDKQLPPYGQEDLKNLRSVFEVKHLQGRIDLLDTQYRMPPQIGQFISDHVYDGELNSNPKHPITDKVLACRLVDAHGKEESDGMSFKNTSEATVILTIAQHLQAANKSYRIITPYDGQRNYIEQEMKKANMDWGDTCFNVDSFQGNEEDFIIVSLVRSRSIGFLSNQRRTNVMLTRCKKGMIVVTSRDFLTGIGSQSLVGDLMKNLEERLKSKAWLSKEEIESGRFWGE